jgi:hypothetical protein
MIKYTEGLTCMMNDADARRQTPGLTTPMSAAHLYWCLGVGVTSHNQLTVSFAMQVGQIKSKNYLDIMAGLFFRELGNFQNLA